MNAAVGELGTSSKFENSHKKLALIFAIFEGNSVLQLLSKELDSGD